MKAYMDAIVKPVAGPGLELRHPLEKRTTAHSSILAWKMPWTVYPWDHKELDTTEWLSLSRLDHFPS